MDVCARVLYVLFRDGVRDFGGKPGGYLREQSGEKLAEPQNNQKQVGCGSITGSLRCRS